MGEKTIRSEIESEVHGRSSGREGAELSLLGAALWCQCQSRQPWSSLRKEVLWGATSLRVWCKEQPELQHEGLLQAAGSRLGFLRFTFTSVTLCIDFKHPAFSSSPHWFLWEN